MLGTVDLMNRLSVECSLGRYWRVLAGHVSFVAVEDIGIFRSTGQRVGPVHSITH
jgi:hypothetical protein